MWSKVMLKLSLVVSGPTTGSLLWILRSYYLRNGLTYHATKGTGKKYKVIFLNDLSGHTKNVAQILRGLRANFYHPSAKKASPLHLS